jgi:hypothetical protein
MGHDRAPARGLPSAERPIEARERLRLVLAEQNVLPVHGLDDELEVAGPHERVAAAAQHGGRLTELRDALFGEQFSLVDASRDFADHLEQPLCGAHVGHVGSTHRRLSRKSCTAVALGNYPIFWGFRASSPVLAADRNASAY